MAWLVGFPIRPGRPCTWLDQTFSCPPCQEWQGVGFAIAALRDNANPYRVAPRRGGFLLEIQRLLIDPRLGNEVFDLPLATNLMQLDD
jgi:hypothetical protein